MNRNSHVAKGMKVEQMALVRDLEGLEEKRSPQYGSANHSSVTAARVKGG